MLKHLLFLNRLDNQSQILCEAFIWMGGGVMTALYLGHMTKMAANANIWLNETFMAILLVFHCCVYTWPRVR